MTTQQANPASHKRQIIEPIGKMTDGRWCIPLSRGPAYMMPAFLTPDDVRRELEERGIDCTGITIQ